LLLFLGVPERVFPEKLAYDSEQGTPILIMGSTYHVTVDLDGMLKWEKRRTHSLTLSLTLPS
jgi:hypothetical protein